MFKKLPLALMMGAALSAGNVFALGMGDIKVDSALNQRLDAEIELISSVEGELDDVTVSLASPSAFDRINLDRPYHLTSLKFKVTTRADGTPIVKLSSEETIREPFLDFLIEVNWPKGRMLREYTVLLDPPVAISAQPPAPMADSSDQEPGKIPYVPDPGEEGAVITGTDELGYPIYGDAGESKAAFTGDTFGPVEADQTLWSIAEQVRSGDVTTQQMMLALFDANPEAFINGDIHHIKKGAVLRIPDQATITSRDQSDAFAQVREINSSLDLAPTAETTAETPGIPETMAPAEPEPVAVTEPPAAEPELKIVGAGEAATAATASSDVDALKRELALATETMSSQKMENDELKSRVMELESAVSEMEELKRLLEVQNAELAQMQNQLDAAASAPEPEMEAPVEPEPLTEAEPAMEMPAEEAPMEEPVAEVEPAEAMPAEEAPAEMVAEPAEEAPEPVEEAPAPAEEAVAEAEPAPEPAPEPLPPPAKKEPMDVVMDYVNKITKDPMLLSIVGGVLLILIALISLVFKRRGQQVEEVGIVETPPEPEEAKPSMFAKLAGMFKKKEKEAVAEITPEAEEVEDITDPGAMQAAEKPAQAPEAPVEEETPEDATVFEAPTPEPEAEPEADFSDMMFEEDESAPADETSHDASIVESEPEAPAGPDPLEEVDVYEAFGDYEQAAEIVKQAIADYPDNNAYKLRLFKVYESGGLPDEFSSAAVEHKDAMAGSPEWGEVEEIGKAFAPDSPAFGGAGAAAPAESEARPAAEAGADMASTMAMDISQAAQVSASTDEAEAAPDTTGEIDLGDLDFELGAGDLTQEGPTVEAETGQGEEEPAVTAMEDEATQALDATASADVVEEAESGGLEFDLEGMDFESAAEPAAEEPAAEEPAAADDGGLEFDLGELDQTGTVTGEEPEPAAAETKAEPAGNELEFDLGDMDFEAAAETTPEETETVAAEDDMSMDFELDDVSTEKFEEPTETVQLDMSAEELEAAATSEEPGSEDPTIMFTDVESDSAAEEPKEDMPETSEGVDLSDFSFDLEESAGSEALGMDEPTTVLDMGGASAAESLSAEGDEVSTKLDLARAYIDMGDSEGAKGILDEVMAEGSEAQKAEAQELLQSA